MTMLIEGTNTLVRSVKWEDPYELYIKGCKIYFEGYKEIEGKEMNWERWYGQCWTKTSDCDGLWRSFTHNEEVRCVKIRTTTKKLYDSLQDSPTNKKYIIIPFISEVNYVDDFDEKTVFDTFESYAKQFIGRFHLNDILDKNDLVKALISYAMLQTKRKPFQYENEVRLFAFDEYGVSKDEVFTYDISSAQDLIEEIEFDPWTPDYMRKTYTDFLRGYGFENSKDKEDVVKFSRLYKKPDKATEFHVHNLRIENVYSSLQTY